MSDGVREPIRNETTVDGSVPVNVPVPDGAPVQEAPWNAGAEQFKDPADAVKSWKSAQQMVSQKDQRISELEAQIAAAQGQPESDPQGGDPTSPDEQPGDAAEQTQDSTFDWDSIGDKYVDPESKWYKPEFVEDLSKAHNLPQEAVESHFEEVKFLRDFYQQAQQQQALEYVGGEENYKALYEWAQQNAADSLADLDDPKRWQVTLMGFKAAMERQGQWPGSQPSAPQEPSQAPGTGTSAAAEAPMSAAEFARATTDPRYNVDRAWTENVQRRFAASGR